MTPSSKPSDSNPQSVKRATNSAILQDPSASASTAVPSSVLKVDSTGESPSKKAKRDTEGTRDSGAALISSSINRPSLRSSPVPTKVKAEAIPVPLLASGSGGEVINVDEDWSDKAPMDFSKSVQSALDRVASPPSDTEPIDSTAEVRPVAPRPRLLPPSSNLPIAKLDAAWSCCARPPRQLTRQFVEAEGFSDRVDMTVFRAVDQRGSANHDDAEWCRQAFERLKEVYRGFYRTPLAVRCDRLLFERPEDSLYIERMAQYLMDDSITTPPILSEPSLYRVAVTGDRSKASQHRLMWAVAIMRKKVLTHEDFFIARKAAIDVNKATVPVKEDEPIMTIPRDLLPSLPGWIGEVVDLRSAPVPPVKALTLFTNTSRNQGPKAYKKWNKALQFELACCRSPLRSVCTPCVGSGSTLVSAGCACSVA